MKKFNDILKIILAIISFVLAFIQFKNGGYNYTFYWIIVAIYWITNYLSGRKK